MNNVLQGVAFKSDKMYFVNRKTNTSVIKTVNTTSNNKVVENDDLDTITMSDERVENAMTENK